VVAVAELLADREVVLVGSDGLVEPPHLPQRKPEVVPRRTFAVAVAELAKPWMELAASGKRLMVDIEEWINKTSGRGSISLGVDNEDGEKPEELASWGVFLGLASYAEVVPRLFAWADVQVHAETYEDAEYDRYEAECVIYDNEGDRFVAEDFDEWRSGRLAQAYGPTPMALVRWTSGG